jgi:hypothetical protein
VDGVKYIDLNDGAYKSGQIALRNFNAGASYRNVVIKQLQDAPDKSGIELQATKDSGGITAGLNNYTTDTVSAKVILAAYDGAGALRYSAVSDAAVSASETGLYRFDFDLAGHADYTYKVFAWDTATFIPLCANVNL